MKICRCFFFITDETKRLRLSYGGLWAAAFVRTMSGAATATELCTRCKYRRLFGAAGVFHPSFSFLENSAHEIHGICIRSHFEYDVLSSQARSALISLFPSFFLSFLSSRRIPFPHLSFLYLVMLSYSVSKIDRRSNLYQWSERIYTTVERSSRNNSMRIHDFSANKRVHIVSIDWFLITSQLTIRYNYYML